MKVQFGFVRNFYLQQQLIWTTVFQNEASQLKNSPSKPGSSFPLSWISYYSVFRKLKTWSENVIHTMGMHPIYYLIIWQNLHSKMEFSKPCWLLTILWKTWKLTAGLKPLFIKYQNVPATWKQMYKWIRNLNTDTSKLRGNLGEVGLVPSAHNSKSNCYLNFPSLKFDAQLHWIPKKMNRTLTLCIVLTHMHCSQCRNRTLYSN